MNTQEKSLRYFPDNSLDTRPELDRFLSVWYSKHLHSMREPIIFNGTQPATLQIRFLWLRTFHSPVVVRVFCSGSQAGLILKTTNGQGGYDTGMVDREEELSLSALELQAIIDRFRILDFYQLSFENSCGCDGAQWILEAAIEGKYHVVTRWSPQSGALREFCLFLLNRAGLTLDKIY
jgi:hypothetical protein